MSNQTTSYARALSALYAHTMKGERHDLHPEN